MRKKRKFLGRPLVVVFWILLLAIPLYPKFPLLGIEGTYVAIRIEDWLVLLSLSLWGVWQFKNKFPILKKGIFKFFLLYWLAGLISLLSGVLITGLIDSKVALFHFFRRVEYMSLFFIAQDAFGAMSKAEFIIAPCLASLLVFAYGMGQRYFGLPVVSTMNEEFSKGLLLRLDKWTRISSSFAGHYDLAAWLVLLLPILIAFISETKNKIARLLLSIVTIINFYLLTLTASRISFVAYLLATTTTLLFLKRFRWLPFILGASLIFGLRSEELSVRLASSFKFLAYLQPKQEEVFEPEAEIVPTVAEVSPPPLSKEEIAPPVVKKEKVLKEARAWPEPEEISFAAARSSEIRFNVEWPRALRAFLKNPLLGTGFSSLGLATDNDYLRILGETGILGFFSFFLIIFHLGRLGLKALLKKKNLLVAGFLGALLGFLANAVFIDVFEASKDAFYFWMMMGVMYGMVQN